MNFDSSIDIIHVERYLILRGELFHSLNFITFSFVALGRSSTLTIKFAASSTKQTSAIGLIAKDVCIEFREPTVFN